jgi:hypothetical protein
MLTKILGKDPDEVFPYKTALIVKIKDYMIGIVWLVLSLIVILYIGLYVFMHLRKFELDEKSKGFVYYEIEGKAYSTNSDGSTVVWDTGDIVYPEMDN